MSEFPEVARRCLSRVPGGADHPDAGLLTAFVEATLTKTHRDEVLDHLVACSECNRLVALLAPAREVASVVQPAELSRRWFAWTPVRWAGAAAAVAVVVTAVVIGRIGEQIKAPTAPLAAAEQAPPPGMTAQLPVAVTAQPRPRRTNKPAPNPREVAESTAVAAQPALEQVDPAITAQSRPAAPGDVRGEMAFQTSTMSSADTWLELEPAAVEPPPVKAARAPVITANLPGTPAPPTGPTWSVSDGVLQKSNDGRTWAAVIVPSRAPLRALSVLGQDIWTGGDQGALFHSTDAGQTWTEVVLTSDGVRLSADILRIAFSDLRHGWIATRKGDIWATRDGGATWSQK